ncbi:hypothetical protein AB0F71_17125 [Kitasatospora sp. NPDC028055]|uniref:hypothetical protein n=1 Tax=Kitasatospora sp. NPDC028055 TaxID=3155653 RepID=UPI0033FC76EA
MAPRVAWIDGWRQTTAEQVGGDGRITAVSVTIDITGLPEERLLFAPSPLAE